LFWTAFLADSGVTLQAFSVENPMWGHEHIGKREDGAAAGRFRGQGEAVGGEVAFPIKGSIGAARRFTGIPALAAIG
jgi:hypothetical protein